jgi:hypothetical protein
LQNIKAWDFQMIESVTRACVSPKAPDVTPLWGRDRREYQPSDARPDSQQACSRANDGIKKPSDMSHTLVVSAFVA